MKQKFAWRPQLKLPYDIAAEGKVDIRWIHIATTEEKFVVTKDEYVDMRTRIDAMDVPGGCLLRTIVFDDDFDILSVNIERILGMYPIRTVEAGRTVNMLYSEDAFDQKSIRKILQNKEYVNDEKISGSGIAYEDIDIDDNADDSIEDEDVSGFPFKVKKEIIGRRLNSMESEEGPDTEDDEQTTEWPNMFGTGKEPPEKRDVSKYPDSIDDNNNDMVNDEKSENDLDDDDEEIPYDPLQDIDPETDDEDEEKEDEDDEQTNGPAFRLFVADKGPIVEQDEPEEEDDPRTKALKEASKHWGKEEDLPEIEDESASSEAIKQMIDEIDSGETENLINDHLAEMGVEPLKEPRMVSTPVDISPEFDEPEAPVKNTIKDEIEVNRDMAKRMNVPNKRFLGVPGAVDGPKKVEAAEAEHRGSFQNSPRKKFYNKEQRRSRREAIDFDDVSFSIGSGKSRRHNIEDDDE